LTPREAAAAITMRRPWVAPGGLRFEDACLGAHSEIFWTALPERLSRLQLRGVAKSKGQTHLAMNLLLLLAVAVPLTCLALLSWLALLGVMTLGAVINVIGMARAGGPQWPRVEPANSSVG
jgi:hypothetical protein